jgi:hypothetical protein
VFTKDQERLRLNQSVLVTDMTLTSRLIWVSPSHGQLNPSWFPSLPTMCSMHLFQPASLVSISWYPTLVGSYWVSHKVLRNPNSSHAIARWTNLPYSTSFILIVPKLVKIVMDKIWFRNVTIWTIFAHVTLLSAFIANATFVLVGHTITYNFFAILASESSSWRRWLPCLVCLKWAYPGRHRSDRWHAPVWPVTVSATAHCGIWARVGKVSLFSALVAHPPLVGASRLSHPEISKFQDVNRKNN